MITHFHAENYKSLQNLDLPLGPLTVLVGPNGSGKSNILDALALLKELVAEGRPADDALAPRGGYRAVVWGGETGARDIGLEVRMDRHIAYGIRLGEVAGQVALKAETLQKGEGVAEVGGKGGQQAVLKRRVEDKVPLPGGAEALAQIRSWAFYRFDPRQMRAPQPVKRDYQLSETGNNLSSVLHTLFSDRSPFFREVLEVLRSAVPTVEDLLSPLADQPGQTYAAIKERGVPSPVTTWGMSDGTLFALALAVALLTPTPPSLVALEAPDTELHPYVLENVAEMLKSAARRTQVIATTHSPYLLNHLPATSLVIVEKHDGKTACRPVKDRKGIQKVIQGLGAGDAWYSGHLGGLP